MGRPTIYPTGTTIYDPERCQNGYTVFTAPGKGVAIINMNGEIVRFYKDVNGFPPRVLPGGHVIVTRAPRGAAFGYQDMGDLTMIDIDGYGTNKLNAAYNYGGAAATIREASQLTGVSISHYAEVSFDELIDLVDAVGGVDVMVDERIDDTDADNTTDHPENPRIIIEAGEQHLNGEQALVFARSRAYVDGDFTRTANQRKLIQALVDKVLALPVTELPGVIQAAAKCVTTDMKVSDIVSLAQQFKDDGDLVMYSAMLPSITGYVDGVSYVFADEDKVTEMMKVVDQGGDPSGITGSTSKLAQKYGAGSSAGGPSSGGAATGSGMYAGNDYGTGGTSAYGGGYSASSAGSSAYYGGSTGGVTGGYADTSSSTSGAGTGGYAGAASTGGSASSYGTGGYATGTGTGASSAY